MSCLTCLAFHSKKIPAFCFSKQKFRLPLYYYEHNFLYEAERQTPDQWLSLSLSLSLLLWHQAWLFYSNLPFWILSDEHSSYVWPPRNLLHLLCMMLFILEKRENISSRILSGSLSLIVTTTAPLHNIILMISLQKQQSQWYLFWIQVMLAHILVILDDHMTACVYRYNFPSCHLREKRFGTEIKERKRCNDVEGEQKKMKQEMNGRKERLSSHLRLQNNCPSFSSFSFSPLSWFIFPHSLPSILFSPPDPSKDYTNFLPFDYETEGR